ncbi:hypothetical protein [Pseudarthrobacter sp. BRE9]|uniref:hypothetical protein n=1 Tax=Pseudarthrobacter sp. BRE9 TaxID=2962582 RepID=UPI0028825298|nr:hypothetical protein [Pseudarthrobacter sp. BRE9]MDT0169738.1 hypothetical protein [Pseudarthrobacter sp. BRE9]
MTTALAPKAELSARFEVTASTLRRVLARTYGSDMPLGSHLEAWLRQRRSNRITPLPAGPRP